MVLHFTARHYNACYNPVCVRPSAVRPSVCLSVCLSVRHVRRYCMETAACITAKVQNQHRMVAMGSSFLTPGSPKGGAKYNLRFSTNNSPWAISKKVQGMNIYGLVVEGKYEIIQRLKWRHSNLWSRYNFVRHDVVLCKVNWWRFVTLFKASSSAVAAWRTRPTHCITADGKIFKQTRLPNHAPVVGDIYFFIYL